MDRLLAVFKLWRGQPLWVKGYAFHGPATVPLEPGVDPRHSRWLLHYLPWDNPAIALSEDDVSSFNAFWTAHSTVSIDNFAVRCFALADHRPYSRDQFLDYVAALEMLFCCDAQSGKGAILRRAGAMILGATLDRHKRGALRDELAALYWIRGRAVHGGKVGFADTPDEWNPRITRARELARDAILLFHDRGLLDAKPGQRRVAIDRMTMGAAQVDLRELTA